MPSWRPGECGTDQDRGAGFQDAADLAGSGGQVGDVMDDRGEPDCVDARVVGGDVGGCAGEDGPEHGVFAHCGGRFDGEHVGGGPPRPECL